MAIDPTHREEDSARRSTGDHTSHGVAQQLSEMARALEAEPTADEVLEAIVAAAVANVPGAQYAGITLVSKRGVLTTPAATDDLVCRIDQVQYTAQQGPCLSSAREHVTVRADDLSTDDRWPEFASQAARIGVRSMLCVQLFVRDDSLGALNMYAQGTEAFDPESEDIGLLLAAHAAVALVGVEREGNLRTALGTRDTIGQAKGVLMERHKIGANAAFQLLIRASQESNRKLSAIAEMVATTGQDLTEENIRTF